MTESDISVIIPVYNSEKYLAEAIESVFSQKLQCVEIIVVDDGSTDSSIKVAGGYGQQVKILQQASNRGPGTARNCGIKASKGGFLAFLDSDDIWTEDKLKNQLNCIKNNKKLDMVFGNVEQFISPELSVQNQNSLRKELVQMPGLVAGAMLIRKEAFLKVGLFDEKLQLAEFIDWFSRAKDAGLKYQVIPEIVLKRRIHTQNRGVLKRGHRKDYISVLHTALGRKRER